MRVQKQISDATVLSTVCSLMSVGGLFALPARSASFAAALLVVYIIFSISVSVVLYRSNYDSRLSILWPAIVISPPCLFFLYLSERYAYLWFGAEYVAGTLFIWFLMPVVGIVLTTPARARQTTRDTFASVTLILAAAAAGWPFALGIFGIVRKDGFVLASGFYFLSCILAFIVGGLARSAWRRL